MIKNIRVIISVAALAAMTVSGAVAAEGTPLKPTYRISKGTEHKIWLHAGGATACFEILSAGSNQPARAHFRRTRAGKGKDLSIHYGAACWIAKAPVYVLYATAVDEDIVVIQKSGPQSPLF
jgi:hypothetical protein